jgi:glycosyltransferase involved in cell wall biosynthesis
MESFIVETLQSIAASTYPNFEIIVMDDGSKDTSLAIAQQFANAHSNLHIRVLTQANQGASAARNNAIKQAKGIYILPVDADDLVAPDYISQAVEVLEQRENVLVVGCEVEMFGDSNKRIAYPPFSLQRLARQNMIAAPSMFRRNDWQRTGGYCKDLKGREDWDFWLSVFAEGGEFVRLPIVGIYYRVHSGSKRIRTQRYKHELVDKLNIRHANYMKRYLGGPLHYHRSWSRFINFFRSEKIVGNYADWEKGEIIHAKRNILRNYNGFISKQFATPSLWRGIIYGWFCKSKAQRSYEYAKRIAGLTSTPVAYREIRYIGILRQSWYVCKQSECKYTFNDLIHNKSFHNRTEILKAIGCFTAELYKRGIFHQDYSGGNILFNEDGSRIEMVDLNRIKFYHHIPIKKGLKIFERLNIDKEALSIMGTAFAQELDLDAEYVINYIITHRWKKHIKQGITNLYD